MSKELTAPGAIGVGIDGSADADRALNWAVAQARLEGRRLVAVMCGDASVSGAAHVGKALEADVPVEPFVSTRDPRDVLVDLSETAHMIVLGSHGRGAVRGLLLGSVSAAVARHASCPVVVCRPPKGDVGGKGVLVGADGTPGSRDIIEFAFAQASIHELPLTVVHCVWDAASALADPQKAPWALAEPAASDVKILLSESVAGLREQYPNVDVNLLPKHGLVDRALGSQGNAWDLVVLGRPPQSRLDRILVGSIAISVLERSRTTVVVVPEAASESDTVFGAAGDAFRL